MSKKLLVINEKRDTRAPFLRGMLTKSLTRSGLDFVDAYRLATEIREDLEDVEHITTEELRGRVVEALAENFPDVVLTRFEEKAFPRAIEVVDTSGESEPFSRGIFIKRLLNCGIAAETCNSITRHVHGRLMRARVKSITPEELIVMAYHETVKQVDRKSANQYLIWTDFHRSNTPLIILIGGVPGSGKSTIATELATQLSIIRTQSTDMLREVMRSLLPKRISPALHESSFTAGKTMHSAGFYKANQPDALESGFNAQSDLVSLACRAVLNRAISERVSMILEGVHIRPNLYNKLRKADAITVPVMLGVLQQKRLKQNFNRRSKIAAERRATRYLKYFEEIWQLQSTILSEADSADIEIIDNTDRDQTVTEICKILTETLSTRYKGRILELQRTYGVSPEKTG